MSAPERNAFDSEQEAVIPNQVPSGFWEMPAKEAALAVAEMNRTRRHRDRFLLGAKNREHANPPDVGNLALTVASARCYSAVDSHYFLRVDPNGSYLAYARSSEERSADHVFDLEQPTFDLRFCSVSYEDARHLAATIWWMERLYNAERHPTVLWGNSFMVSSGDGYGAFTFHDHRGTAHIDINAKVWSSNLSERWFNAFDRETLLNFTCHLLTKVLPDHLGDAWNAPGFTHPQLTAHTQRFLDAFSPAQDRVSNTLVACAAEAAGTLLMSETKPSLENILATLPAPPARPARVLHGERDSSSTHDLDEDTSEVLREAVLSALRKMETADDPAALHEWAISQTAGNRWALRRLSRIDSKLYVQALETWTQDAEPRRAHQLLEAIRRIDPARAAVIAASIPPLPPLGSAADAFAPLQSEDQQTDEPEHFEALENPTLGRSDAPSVHAIEPASFTFMLRGYCYAGNTQDDPKAFGGYAKSDNLPKPLTATTASPDLHLELVETTDVVFAEKYAGLHVRLVNGSEDTAEIPASDSRLALVQEAQDSDGTWKEIEYLPQSWCGNSYHAVYLPAKHYWEFTAPKYSGPQQTRLRFKLTLSPERVLYSTSYEGGIHPEQFNQKQPRRPVDLMDPHAE